MIDELVWRPAEHFHDTSQLLDLVLAGEERIAGVEFGEDATQAPHVNRRAVGQTEDHLGATIEPRLDVRVDALVAVARRAKVDDLDRAATALLQQNVLLWKEKERNMGD